MLLPDGFYRTKEGIKKMVAESVRSVLTQAKERRMPILRVFQLLKSNNQ